jgi:hypothetical protein
MPVFFLVGGYANLAAWDRAAGSARAFLRARLTRLLRPTAVFLGARVVLETVLLLVVPGYPGVLSYGRVVATPLWFLAAYLWVVLLVPVTAAAHRRAAGPTVVLLGLGVVGADLARFGAGLQLFGLVNTALVWVFVHQLGYLWRDRMLDSPGRRRALAAAGLTGLVVVAALPVYPRSIGRRSTQPGLDSIEELVASGPGRTADDPPGRAGQLGHRCGRRARPPASTVPERPSTTSSNRAARPGVNSAMPVANSVGVGPGGAQERGLVHPDRAHRPLLRGRRGAGRAGPHPRSAACRGR